LADRSRLKEIVSLLRLDYERLPLDGGGRIDVYALVRDGRVSLERGVEIFRSERSKRGPTAAQVLAGDYSEFPYERGSGAVGQAILLDPEPTGEPKARLAAYLNGNVVRLDDE